MTLCVTLEMTIPKILFPRNAPSVAAFTGVECEASTYVPMEVSTLVTVAMEISNGDKRQNMKHLHLECIVQCNDTRNGTCHHSLSKRLHTVSW